MTALLYVAGVLVFVVAILASIGLHEFGHLIPAKKFGCKVPQWFIGFGPTVWSKKIGDTEYGVKAIPLGGYVKIVGMLPPGAEDLVEETETNEHGEQVHKVRRSNTGLFTQLISDARAAEWEYVKAHETDRLFYRMDWWKKVIVMAGGPMVNVVIAFFCFLAIFSTVGVSHQEVKGGSPVVETVAQCVLPATEAGRECTADDPVTPAVRAGLKPGDQIVAFNGEPVTDWRELQRLIRDNSDGRAHIVVERDGQQLTLTTNTTVTARPTSETDATLRQVGFLGLTPETTIVTEKGGVFFTLDRMGTMTVDTVKALGTLPVKVWGVAEAIVGVQERALDSPVSIVGGGRFAGEAASHSEISMKDKLVFLMMLIGGFNLFIGLFNFVPLLPLDGGHIAGALYEAARRGLARLRGRPDPGHVDVAKLLPVAYIVGLAMLLMGVVLIIGDLVVPLHLTS